VEDDFPELFSKFEIRCLFDTSTTAYQYAGKARNERDTTGTT